MNTDDIVKNWRKPMLDWDCLDGGCQAAQTPLGRITAWEDGTLVVPGRENWRYESLLAAKIAANQLIKELDE